MNQFALKIEGNVFRDVLLAINDTSDNSNRATLFKRRKNPSAKNQQGTEGTDKGSEVADLR